MHSVKIRKSYQRIPEALAAAGGAGTAESDAVSPSSLRRRTRSRTIASIFGHDQLLADLQAQSQRRAASVGGADRDEEAVRDATPSASNNSSRASLAPPPTMGEKERGRRFSGSQASQSGGMLAPGPSRRSHDASVRGYSISETPQLELLIPDNPQHPGLLERSFEMPGHLDLEGDHHDDAIVEHLDAIDPEVAAVADLSNAANTILFPPIHFYNRKPIIQLPKRTHLDALVRVETTDEKKDREKREADYDELDHHVDDVLSRRTKIRRSLRGLWKFLKTPQGIITGIYGFLVVFWGAGLVLILAKWINFHNANTQGFWVEISSQILNGLFTATGVGFIPWRLIDTWRIVKIWYFKHQTHRLRRKGGIPALVDEDDLPDPTLDPNYVHVLTDEQQFELKYQQYQFQKSQTWYRPHGTSTHKAFPISLALLVCLLVDGNSVFQVLLCYVMWGYDRFSRPAWTTGTLIPLSFLCGIAAAIVTWYGGRKTRRTKEVEERLKAALAFERHTGLPAGIGATCVVDENESVIDGTPVTRSFNEKEGSVANGRMSRSSVRFADGTAEGRRSGVGERERHGEKSEKNFMDMVESPLESPKMTFGRHSATPSPIPPAPAPSHASPLRKEVPLPTPDSEVQLPGALR